MKSFKVTFIELKKKKIMQRGHKKAQSSTCSTDGLENRAKILFGGQVQKLDNIQHDSHQAQRMIRATVNRNTVA